MKIVNRPLKLALIAIIVTSTTAWAQSKTYTNVENNAATIDTTGNIALTVNNADAATQSGDISGTGALTKSGSGTLTLTGANTYTGGTQIDNGTLSIASDSALGAVPATSTTNLTFNGGTLATDTSFSINTNRLISLGSSGGTFNVDTGDTLSYSGAISGSGGLTKTGVGTLFLSNAEINSYTGDTLINGGTLFVQNRSPTNYNVNTWKSGRIINNGELVLQSSFQNPLQDPIQIFEYQYILDTGITGTGNVTFATRTVVTTPQFYTGLTTVKSGSRLLLEDIGGQEQSLSNETVVHLEPNSNLNINTSKSLKIAGITGSGNIRGGGTTSLTLNIPSNQTQVFSGTIGDFDNLIKSGLGTQIFSNASPSFLGDTTINEGTLAITNSGALGAGNGTLTLNGGTLDLGTYSPSFGTVIFNGGTFSNGSLSNSGAFEARTGSLAAHLTGSAGLTKTGSSIFTLSGNNSYTGGTSITEGTLQIGSSSALGATSSVSIAADAKLDLNDFSVMIAGLDGAGQIDLGSATLTTGNNNVHSFSGTISGTGSLIKIGASTLTLLGSNSYTGGTTVSEGTLIGTNTSLQGNITNNATLNFDQESLGNYTGNLDGSGSLIKTGAGNLILSGTNSYIGDTVVNAGTLTLGSAMALSGTSSVEIASGTTLDLNNNSVTLSNLDGAGAITFGSASLTTGDSDDHTLSGILSGSGSLYKSGTGTLTLSGANSYSGGTTIADGTLTVSSAASLGTGNVSVTGGSLAGTGGLTLDRTVSVDGASSTLNTGIYLEFGGTGTGSLTVSNGALVNSGSTTAFGLQASSDGTGSVNGTGSRLDVAEILYLGFLGNGALTVGNGGTVTSGAVYFSSGGGSSTFNLNDGGTLETRDIDTGTGSAQFNLAGGTLKVTGASFSTSITTTLATSTNSTINTNGNNAAFLGSLSGAGSLIKTGIGNLTLSGINSYSGGTTVAGGTLTIASNANLGAASGALSVNSGATLYAGTNFQTDRAVTLDGSGTQLLTGNGELVIGSAGTGSLSMTNGAAASAFNVTLGLSGGTGTVDIASGSVLTANNSTSLSGTSTLNLNTGGTLSTFGLSGSGSFNLAGGTLRSNGALSSSLAANLSNASTVDTNGYATILSGNLTGSGSLTKIGTGNLTLSGSNTYSGGTTVSAGTLTSNSASLPGNIANNGAVVFDQSATGTYSGIISGTGSLTKSGTGNLTFSGNNSYSGGTTVSGGTLTVSSDANLGAASGALVVNSGATLNAGTNFRTNRAVTLDGSGTQLLTGNGELVIGSAGTGSLTMTNGAAASAFNVTLGLSGGTGTVDIASGSVLTANNSTSLSATSTLNLNTGGTLSTFGLSGSGSFNLAGGILKSNGALNSSIEANLTNASTVDTNGYASTLSGVLSGDGSLTKSGAGKLTLSGNNSYLGGTTVSGGTLTVASNANLGAASGPLAVNSGATLNAGTNFQADRAITLDGSGTSLTTNNGELVIGSAGTGSLAMTNSATASAFNLTLGLSGGTGTVDIASGSVLTANNSTFLSGTSTLNLNTGGTLSTFGLSGSGSFNLAGGTLRSNGSLNSSLAANLSNASTVDTNGYATTLSGALSGSGSLTKTGTGSLTLSGENSYSGGTTVVGGTILLANTSGSAFGTGDVTVSSGATIGGVGSFDGALVVETGGTFAPGNSPGLVTVGSGTTLSGTLEMEIGGTIRGTEYDAINVSGDGLITLGGILNVSLIGGFEPGGDLAFQFIDAEEISGTFAEINLPTLEGYFWNQGSFYNDGFMYLNAVPEPSTCLLLGGVFSLLMSRRQRRS